MIYDANDIWNQVTDNGKWRRKEGGRTTHLKQTTTHRGLGTNERKNIDYPKNYPQVEPQRRRPNIDKIKKELKFKNRVTISSAVKRFYKWSKSYY